jgi:hypothetical protein
MYLQSERIWIDETFQPAILRIDDSKVRNVLPYGSVEPDSSISIRMVISAPTRMR